MAMRQYVRDRKGQFAETPGGGLASRLVGEWRSSALGGAKPSTPSAPAPAAPSGGVDPAKITLAKAAPWATPEEIRDTPRLRNGYRERFAFVGGRRFRLSADSLESMWWTEEVDAKGEPLSVDAFGKWAFRLGDARQHIADEVARGNADKPSTAAPQSPPRSGDVLAERLRGEMAAPKGARRYSVNFRGETFSRTSETTYPWASRDERGKVRFHTSESAAKRGAGRFGEVSRTDAPLEAADPIKGEVWVVRFTDGTTAEVTVDRSTPPTLAAMRAHPGKRVAGASRKS